MDLFEVIEKRRSIRSYKPTPIPNEHLKKILEAARLAPSGKNLQPWRFIIVRNPERKRMLAEAAMNQMFIAEADVVIVALSDPTIFFNWHQKENSIFAGSNDCHRTYDFGCNGSWIWNMLDRCIQRR